MARPLQLLSSLLSRARVGALSPQSSTPFTSRRFVNKVPSSRSWAPHSQRAPRDSHMSDEEYGLEEEDVEDKIQALVDKENKKRKAVKYQILRRQMTPKGPPQRKLTWEAIEQIRYLKQEQPEEWTVERLAEGFSVNPDAILRVLKSKFVPSPNRKAKQDAKVMVKINQQTLPAGAGVRQEKQRLSAGSTQAVLASGNRETAVVPVGHQTLMLQSEQRPAVSAMATQTVSEITEYTTERPNEETQPTDSTAQEVDEEGWDGQVLSEEDIERLMTTIKSSPVVKVGNDVFDTEGNFLYRI